jgi:hypothetical protein
MQTWFDYCEKMVLSVNAAQAGNPYFKGAFLFQLAGWYAIRARASRPVTYQYRDGNGTLKEQTNETVAHWSHYNDLNPVVKGQDLEMFAAAPWFSGFIHEVSSTTVTVATVSTTTAMPAQPWQCQHNHCDASATMAMSAQPLQCQQNHCNVSTQLRCSRHSDLIRTAPNRTSNRTKSEFEPHPQSEFEPYPNRNSNRTPNRNGTPIGRRVVVTS